MLAEAAVLVLGELPDEATVAASAREIRVSWPEAEPAAGSAVAGYEVQWRSGNQGWDSERRRVVIGLSYLIRGLDDGVAYSVRVRPAAVETAEVQGASIVAGEGSAPTAEIVADPPPLNPNVHQSVLPLAGAVNFEMTGEAVWPATIIMPVDLDLVGDDDSVQLMFYNESLDVWVPSPGAVLDRERGVITAEVYHLSIGTAAKCFIPWMCQAVSDIIDAGAEFAQQQAARVATLVADKWDDATGLLREGWSRTGEFVFGDLPELIRQVRERMKHFGLQFDPWVEEWLSRVENQVIWEWFKTMTIKRFGYGISRPYCPGDRPDWAAPSRLVPDKDIVLHCDDTAADRGDSRDDLLLKLTVNRTYGLTVRSGDARTQIVYRSPEHISVEQVDSPAALEDLLSGAGIAILTDRVFVPPGGTASLRIPLAALRDQAGSGDQTKSSTELIYTADALSLVLQALLLVVDIAGGRAAHLVTGFKCAASGIAGSANADQSDDRRAWIDAAVGVVDNCLLSVIPGVGNLMLAIGAVVLLNEGRAMIADGAWSDAHRIIAESKWTIPPDAAASSINASQTSVPSATDDPPPNGQTAPAASAVSGVIAAGWEHTCALQTDSTIACWGNNSQGQRDAPPGAHTAIAASGNHTCALRTNQTITCWGSNDNGETDALPGTYSAVTAGWGHTCALRTNQTITCWGNNSQGQTDAPTGTYSAVAAGGTHTCALQTDNTITCWGSNYTGETRPPPGTYSTVSANGTHTCALRTDGTAACWGNPIDGLTNPPPGTNTAITAGGNHACALQTDNTITCWGNNEYGQTNPHPGTYTAVAAGGTHTCALQTDNTITCWGHNNHGQTNPHSGTYGPTDDTYADTTTPTRGTAIFKAITAGWGHSCGLRTDDTIACWGYNDEGQADAPSGTFKAITTGWWHSCGLRTDDTIACWGPNDHGQADAPSGTFKAITTGWGHSCGLRTDDTITCWGYNWSGQADAPSGTFKAIAAGWGHSCGLRTDDTIACWGYNDEGQADAPSGTFKAITTGVYHHICGLRTDDTIACWGPNDHGQTDAPSGTFKAITTREGHSCGLRTDDTIACWGPNDYGQTDAPSGTFKAITTGEGHSCGLRTDDTITCWGDNRSGQADAPSGTFKAITTGNFHTCGLRTDDTITCWGANNHGQRTAPGGQYGPTSDTTATADGTDTFKAVAVAASHSCVIRTDDTIACSYDSEANDLDTAFGQADAPGGNFKAVAASYSHTCAIRMDGTIACWGGNRYSGQPPSEGTYSAITAGDGHSCALRTDDTIACWGNNDYGQAEAPSGTYKALEASWYHSCALRTDDTIACWGNNDYGQAEAPSGTYKAVATGQFTTCAIRLDDALTCWGGNDYLTDAPSGTFKAVGVAVWHACGLRADGTITCWSGDDYLTDPPSGTYETLLVGNYSFCAVRADYDIVCWPSSRPELMELLQ